MLTGNISVTYRFTTQIHVSLRLCKKNGNFTHETWHTKVPWTSQTKITTKEKCANIYMPCPKIALQCTVLISIPCELAKASIISNPTCFKPKEKERIWNLFIKPKKNKTWKLKVWYSTLCLVPLNLTPGLPKPTNSHGCGAAVQK